MATMKERIKMLKEAIQDAEHLDAEDGLVNMGGAAYHVGLQLIEYYEACEDLGVAAVGSDGMLPQWERFEAARKALNEG